MAEILKLVAASAVYPRNRDSVRPFRLWDASAKKPLRWRCYSDKIRAHNGALIECRWSKIDVSIEVVDIRYGRLLGVYTRRVKGVDYWDPKVAEE